MSDRSTDHPEAGYICIWGTSTKEKVIDREGVVIQCGACGQEARMIGKSAVPHCSIFYIPLFPEGSGEEFFECSSCGGKFQGSTSEIRARLAERQQELEGKIAEKRRAHESAPDDADTARELAELLFAADRDAEARSLVDRLLSRDPADVNALILLGKMQCSRESWVTARETFARAVELSPQHAGALYFRALSLASGENPRFPEALEIARRADRAGHPQARELVDALEEEIRGEA